MDIPEKGLSRAVALMTHLVDTEAASLGVRELSAELDLPPSTVHRLLNILSVYGWVGRTRHGYALGLEFSRLAWKVTGRFGIREVAQPILSQLVEEINETARMVLYDRPRRMTLTVLTVESTQRLRYLPPINQWAPLTAGSSSMAIVAALVAEERQLIAAAGLPSASGDAILEADQIEEECKLITARGFATSHGRRFAEIAGVSAAVFDVNGDVVGAVAIGIPISRHTPQLDQVIGLAARRAADQITTRIGGDPRELTRLRNTRVKGATGHARPRP